MSKLTAVLLAFAVFFGLAGCGSSSDIMLSDFEENMFINIPDNWDENKEKTSRGYTVLYDYTQRDADGTLKLELDKEEKIRSLSLVLLENYDSELVMKGTNDEVYKYLINLDNSEQLKFNSSKFIFNCCAMVDALLQRDMEMSAFEIVDKARTSGCKVGGWKFTLRISGETVVFNAEYSG